ncbi:hypothetical protein CANCADRAFT_22070 [Tortispora caseinolytica NRRL Y-17796]|uniref:MOSC domain-containing protein n=1 Tax=Tortispora caseinolytica NRRL Y-17796 TaxID=767744 RepID=A0A1E4TJK0_9ASCO|nr:hypothetical protein CANCADRAFT_22070 [Tortispora caseinolytica NRRL Y-17796]
MTIIKETESFILNGSYGYGYQLEAIKRKCYPQIKNQVYLDHAGVALPNAIAIDQFAEYMKSHLLGNPHSYSPSSQLASIEIEKVRRQVLQMLKASPSEFVVIFTSNTTSALKLILEAVGSSSASDSTYRFLDASHTSVVGLREGFKQYQCLSESEVACWLQQYSDESGLFAYPRQSNFSGARYPIDWISTIGNHHPNYYTLLDAASYMCSGSLDYSDYTASPHFTVFSFMKMFGFPDLAALVVRRDATTFFSFKKYFGGGTVDAYVPDSDFSARKTVLYEQLEDGSLPIHNLVALQCAIDSHLQTFGSIDAVHSHIRSVYRYAMSKLLQLRYSNGNPCIHIYGRNYLDENAQGPIIALNVLNRNGSWYGYKDLERLMSLHDVNIRTGRHCNVGDAMQWLGLSGKTLKRYYEMGHICGDSMDIIDNVPTGCARISVGAETSAEDIDFVLSIIHNYIVRPQDEGTMMTGRPGEKQLSINVTELSIYPIKSCGAYKISRGVRWPINVGGLAWDRQFCVISLDSDKILSQKVHPNMTLIQPIVDLEHMELKLRYAKDESSEELSVSLMNPVESLIVPIKVCGANYNIERFTDKSIEEFFTRSIGVACTLARFPKEDVGLSFANEYPLLIINQQSVNYLNKSIGAVEVTAATFRGNIVVDGDIDAYSEDNWKGISFGDFELNEIGPCKRCLMITNEQETGLKRKEPYSTLSKTRKTAKGIMFGEHYTFRSESAEGYIKIGDKGLVRVN